MIDYVRSMTQVKCDTHTYIYKGLQMCKRVANVQNLLQVDDGDKNFKVTLEFMMMTPVLTYKHYLCADVDGNCRLWVSQVIYLVSRSTKCKNT